NSSLHHDMSDVAKRLHEFSEFLIKVLKVDDLGAELNGKATYHDSCAGLRECRIKEEPRKLLSRVKGLELAEMNDVETCCGFGGTFAVKFEAISIGMGEQKVENALATGAQYLISTDHSCLMHLQGYIKHKGYSLKTLHLADVLANGWEIDVAFNGKTGTQMNTGRVCFLIRTLLPTNHICILKGGSFYFRENGFSIYEIHRVIDLTTNGFFQQ